MPISQHAGFTMIDNTTKIRNHVQKYTKSILAISFACCVIGLVHPKLLIAAATQWPVNPDVRSNLRQDYAEFNAVKTNYYHTGLDIVGTSSSLVQAAIGGRIVKIQENDIGC